MCLVSLLSIGIFLTYFFTVYLLLSVTQNPRHWQPLSNDQNLRHYSRSLHGLAQAVLLTIEGHPSGYTFPINNVTIQDGKNLLLCLNNPPIENNRVLAFHKFVYPFLSAQEIQGEYNKWLEVLECFLAIYCLCSDGNYKPGSDATQVFAICKYLCRGSTLYEAILQADKFQSPYK